MIFLYDLHSTSCTFVLKQSSSNFVRQTLFTAHPIPISGKLKLKLIMSCPFLFCLIFILLHQFKYVHIESRSRSAQAHGCLTLERICINIIDISAACCQFFEDLPLTGGSRGFGWHLQLDHDCLSRCLSLFFCALRGSAI